MRERLRRFGPLGLTGLILLLSACASDAPQDSLQPEGPIAREIDNLVSPVFLVAGVVFVFVELGVLFLAMKFRRRKDDPEDVVPPQVHGNMKAELGWTILPAVILAVIAVFTLGTLFSIKAKADDADMTVEVVGQQWWWEFRYDTDGDGEADIVTANDLVVPAGQTINLEITSRDVIHSFNFPRLNGTKDAVPGMTSDLTVEADEPGTYVGQCREYCGLSHAYMRQRLVAMDQADFDAWVQNQQSAAEAPEDGSEAAAGAEVFATQCSRCHLARGINDDEYAEQTEGNDAGDTNGDGQPDVAATVSGAAPDLTHFATRGAFAGAMSSLWVDADEDGIVEAEEIGGELDTAALEEWLRDPDSVKPMAAHDLDGTANRGMPNYELSEEQIDQLVAFLETLD
jgi:cytochrome c oxidase subunit II